MPGDPWLPAQMAVTVTGRSWKLCVCVDGACWQQAEARWANLCFRIPQESFSESFFNRSVPEWRPQTPANWKPVSGKRQRGKSGMEAQCRALQLPFLTRPPPLLGRCPQVWVSSSLSRAGLHPTTEGGRARCLLRGLGEEIPSTCSL